MKQKISVAAPELKPKDMSRNHYTTLGFGSITPVFCDEVVPRDKVNLQVSNFTRLAAMKLPNLGSIDLKLHAFYVPYRLVWNHFDNFKEGLPSWNSLGAQVYKFVPYVDDTFFTRLFTDSSVQGFGGLKLCSSVGTSSTVQGGFDFSVLVQGEDVPSYYRFTSAGKSVYHILCSLGYNFNFIDLSNGSGTISHTLSNNYSALPLLCWFKLYLDYFIPSQLQPSSYIHQLFNYLHEASAQDIATGNWFGDYLDLVRNCFSQTLIYYQNNYFSSAWQSPNAVLSGLNNIGSTSTDRPILNSVDSQSSTVSNFNQALQSTDDNVRRSYDNSNLGTFAGTSALSSDGLSFMQKFARFIKRSNFAGSRVVERILARYGVRVDDFQIGMSKYLGSDTIQLQKSDVTVTGNSAEAGDYAGKGWLSGQGRTFKCNCDYFGMIFVTASLEVPSTPVTGVRRRNMHLQPLDFWTPELDGGQMQAISGAELYGGCKLVNAVNSQILSNAGFEREQVFGFTPRYSEMKMAIDDVTGDFVLPRFAQDIDSFILPRRFFDENGLYDAFTAGNDDQTLANWSYFPDLYKSDYSATVEKVTPTSLLYGEDMVQFNRIFKDIKGESDPFFSVFHFNCVINSPTLPLNESSELVGKGRLLEFETNGKHL